MPVLVAVDARERELLPYPSGVRVGDLAQQQLRADAQDVATHQARDSCQPVSRMSSAETIVRVTATVQSVRLISPNTAKVVFTVTVGGQPLLPDAPGYAVRIDGKKPSELWRFRIAVSE